MKSDRILKALVGAVAALAATAATASAATYTVSPIAELSGRCSGQNAEVEQAVDPKLGYVYELWMGCNGIGFARSTNGGASFGPAVAVPAATSTSNTWDPAIAVAPDGTVYAAFMLSKSNKYYPVVDASFDHGATFSQTTALIPAQNKNWGDRDFIVVGSDGTVYVTWDYGPSRSLVAYYCPPAGSCTFTAGDFNVVMQKSTDRGRTFGAMTHVSPGFPDGGADSGPMVIDPSGRVDVLYQGYQITDTTKDTLGRAYSYFTASINHGATWSAPVRVGSQAGTMAPTEWWIDGAVGIDGGGNLYATWDTQGTTVQGAATDTGWLSYSSDGGTTWSAPVQAPADAVNAPHIMEVAGGGSGIAYAAWLSDSTPQGYAQYLRAFSIHSGWLSAPFQVSRQFGNASVWPGDTFGISALSPTRLVLSWGSALPPSGTTSEIYSADVTASLP